MTEIRSASGELRHKGFFERRTLARKILFLHHGGGIGGAPVSMLQLAASLDRSQYEPLVVFSESGPILDFARDLGVPARVVSLPSAFFYGAQVPIRVRMLASFSLNFWSTARAAEALMRREQPDLVHLNTSVLMPVAIGVKRLGIPLVWHVREVPGRAAWLRRMQTGTIIRLADTIVANSEVVRQAFPSNANIAVVHNAVDLKRFCIDVPKARARIRTELGLSDTAAVVGMIGSVQTVKGHDLLVRAASRVVKRVPDARFVVVAGGVGPDYRSSWKGYLKRAMGRPLDNLERMKRQVQAAGLDEHFAFTGYRGDIPEILAAVDVLAFLSQAPEGFGRPLIEAMAMGRPVVASDIGPAREVLGDGTAILVSPGDASGLSEALVALLTDSDTQALMGRAGRRRVEDMFTLDRSVEHIQRLYYEMLQRCRTAGAGAVKAIN